MGGSNWHATNCPSCRNLANYFIQTGLASYAGTEVIGHTDLLKTLCDYAFGSPTKRVRPIDAVLSQIATLAPELLPICAAHEGRQHDWARKALSGEPNKRELYGAAACAAAIRVTMEKDFPGVKIKHVRSDNSAVRVVLHSDTSIEDYNRVERAICGRYQMGHFDGMEDIYEYSNRQEGVPQAMYIFVSMRD